jgi:lipopolysaccharide biosynthesis regulator YciM
LRLRIGIVSWELNRGKCASFNFVIPDTDGLIKGLVPVQKLVLSIVVGLVSVVPNTVVVRADQAKLSQSQPATQLKISQTTNSTNNQSSNGLAAQGWELIQTAQQAEKSGQTAPAVAALAQAQSITNQITDTVIKDQLLSKIAIHFASLKQFDQAIAISQSISYSTNAQEYCCIPFRTEAEIGIAQAYLQGKQYNSAISFVKGIRNAGSRNQAIVPVVTELATQGRFEDAIALSKTITNDGLQKSRAQFGIVKGYINRGQFERGLAFTKAPDTSDRGNAQLTLVQSALRAGKFDQARRIAEQISDGGIKLQAMTEVALAYKSVGQSEQAISLLSQAYQLAKPQPGNQSSAAWVGYFAQAGAYDRASQISNRFKDEYSRLSTRLQIAQAYLQAGQLNQAFERAQTVPEGKLQPFGDIPDPKVEVIQGIVQRSLKTGQFELAIRAARSLNNPRIKVRALRTIAQTYAKQGQTNRALAVLTQAVEVAKNTRSVVVVLDRMTSYSESNAGLLVNLAEDYARFKQTELAIATLNAASQSAQNFDYRQNSYASGSLSAMPLKVKALTQVARAYTQLGQMQPAIALLDQAAKVAQTVDDSAKVEVLTDVAIGYGKAGKVDAAQPLLSQARQLSQKTTVFWLPSRVAEAYAAVGLNQEAATVVEEFLRLPPSQLEPSLDARIERFAIAVAASESPDLSLQLVEKIQAQPPKVTALANIAAKYLDSDRQPQATLVTNKLLQAINQIANPVQRDITLQNLFINQIPAPTTPEGWIRRYNLQVLIQQQIQDSVTKSQNLANLSLEYAKQGEMTSARNVLSSALQSTQTIAEPYDRQQILLQMFDNTVRAGYYDLASLVANAFQEPSYKITALRQLAQHYQSLGQKDNAITALSQAKQVANAMADAAEKQQILQAINLQQSRL